MCKILESDLNLILSNLVWTLPGHWAIFGIINGEAKKERKLNLTVLTLHKINQKINPDTLNIEVKLIIGKRAEKGQVSQQMNS